MSNPAPRWTRCPRFLVAHRPRASRTRGIGLERTCRLKRFWDRDPYRNRGASRAQISFEGALSGTRDGSITFGGAFPGARSRTRFCRRSSRADARHLFAAKESQAPPLSAPLSNPGWSPYVEVNQFRDSRRTIQGYCRPASHFRLDVVRCYGVGCKTDERIQGGFDAPSDHRCCRTRPGGDRCARLRPQLRYRHHRPGRRPRRAVGHRPLYRQPGRHHRHRVRSSGSCAAPANPNPTSISFSLAPGETGIFEDVILDQFGLASANGAFYVTASDTGDRQLENLRLRRLGDLRPGFRGRARCRLRPRRAAPPPWSV